MKALYKIASSKKPRNFGRVLTSAAVMLLLTACSTNSSDGPSSLPRVMSFSEMSFAGAFSLPSDDFGASNLNYAQGVMEVNDGSLFIVGHQHDDAIAEFFIPDLTASFDINALASTGAPVQQFSPVLNRVANGNPEALDQITGLEVVNGSLVINAIEFYDAPADNTATTLVLSDANNLNGSSVSALHHMEGSARASGWLSKVPREWRDRLGAGYISGNASGDPIIARHSAGPSAFAVDFPSDLRSATPRRIEASELQGFSLDEPLHTDLSNESGSNSLWTHISHARYGFIVPGTRTYMTLGWSGGHQSGVSYKNTLEDGFECPGYCPNSMTDFYNYYWLWDMEDWARVQSGEMQPHDVMPYESGEFDLPFQTTEYINEIGGASFDEATGLLYISVLRANPSGFNNPPVIVAFSMNDGGQLARR